MSDPRFLQTGFDKILSHAIEESGEFIAAAGKTQRWGVHSVNPLLPPTERESNLSWMRREMNDVVSVFRRLDKAMQEEIGTDPMYLWPLEISVAELAAQSATILTLRSALEPLMRAQLTETPSTGMFACDYCDGTGQGHDGVNHSVGCPVAKARTALQTTEQETT